RDLRQEITDQIIEALEKGTAPWQKPWKSGAFELPFNPTSGKSYRGGNAIHLMATASRHGYEDPRWLTYRQAQENGWQVRRGERGTQVEFWQFPGSGTRLSGAREDNDPREPADRDRFIYRA
ncbi:MAG: ArdC family protein, partial [Acidobacteria bacterium]|nr:ArdC family protein [Acidobacteriota bacterium]